MRQKTLWYTGDGILTLQMATSRDRGVNVLAQGIGFTVPTSLEEQVLKDYHNNIPLTASQNHVILPMGRHPFRAPLSHYVARHELCRPDPVD